MEATRRRRSVRLGEISGIELTIHWSWLIVAGAVTASIALLWLPAVQPGWGGVRRWPVAAVCALCFFISLLLHELAHALVAQRRGIPVLGITLFLLGGVAKLGSDPGSARDEFHIAVVGPLASFALSLLFGAALWGAQWLQLETLATMALYLAVVNAVIGVFNLLPGFPLDGGRILRAGLWRLTRDFQSATRIAFALGRAVAVGLVALSGWLVFQVGIGGIWMGLLGVFLWRAGRTQLAPLHESAGGAF
jgi:Zn-dependent protease